MAQKKYSNSRQSSETKPSTKLVLESREPLLYLEFNKPNKKNVYGINSFNKFSFPQSQNNCWHTDCWFQGTAASKVRLTSAQGPTVSQLKGVSDTFSNSWESPNTEDTNFHRR